MKRLMLLPCLILAGCTNKDATYLVFAQQQTFGLSISGSVPQQDAKISLGFADNNIAVIPATIKSGDSVHPITGSIGGDSFNRCATEPAPPATDSDALSTFGQFSLDNTTGDQNKLGLGKFFATGSAAQVISQGFADKVGNRTPVSPPVVHCPNSAPPAAAAGPAG